MPISWIEIRHDAIRFSREWAGVKSESAEKQTFWNEFFQVFGIKRRAVASFEESVKKITGDCGRIDLFWPGKMLVEHNSFGENLHKAETQAFQYIRDLANDPKRLQEGIDKRNEVTLRRQAERNNVKSDFLAKIKATPT